MKIGKIFILENQTIQPFVDWDNTLMGGNHMDIDLKLKCLYIFSLCISGYCEIEKEHLGVNSALGDFSKIERYSYPCSTVYGNIKDGSV